MEELAALFQALLIILFFGGLALLAQWGRKNRGAEVSLIVSVLFASSLVAALGAVIALVGISNAVPSSEASPGLIVGSGAIILLAGVAGICLCIPPIRRVAGRHNATARHGEDTTAHDSLARSTVQFSDSEAAGGWWSDPPIFFALWAFVNIFAINAVFLLVFALEPEGASSTLASAGRVSFFIVFFSQLPLVIVALCGVGIGVRRSFRETLARLGYGPVTLPQLGIVALFIVGALLISFAFDALFATLQPDLFEQVGEVSAGLFSPEGLSPASVILFALLIGIGAALGEETLFRGALQPRLGIILTSILWAVIHVQYGPSVLLINIFVLSLALGFLRKRINTTATFLVHASYNFLTVLLAYFLGGY
ncbi:MAG: CPBP family intramembrane metalloprotease [Rubrobacter sp.]|nr:CPBP family intramembrane metalloprotease [Rubrobacter sp.]